MQFIKGARASVRIEHETREGDGADTLLTTRQAAAFCLFKDGSAIRHAVRRGHLRPFGRRGGTGTWIFRRSELERYMLGANDHSGNDTAK